ncbi:hypothetical protein Tco_0822467 [Tanacetum coccineum]|uniref:Reverse transcriptase domain-containing protein n=1 Tax=Tanacetum coccineum TaxID=301880 RepID=A0ABQ5AG53_9ASTR
MRQVEEKKLEEVPNEVSRPFPEWYSPRKSKCSGQCIEQKGTSKAITGSGLGYDHWFGPSQADFGGSDLRQENQKTSRSTDVGVPLDKIHIDDKLHFIEEPVEILDREVRNLRRSRIPIIKVRWNSKRGPEFTWEHEDQFREKYPHLLPQKPAPHTLEKWLYLEPWDKALLTGGDCMTASNIPSLLGQTLGDPLDIQVRKIIHTRARSLALAFPAALLWGHKKKPNTGGYNEHIRAFIRNAQTQD